MKILGVERSLIVPAEKKYYGLACDVFYLLKQAGNYYGSYVGLLFHTHI